MQKINVSQYLCQTRINEENAHVIQNMQSHTAVAVCKLQAAQERLIDPVFSHLPNLPIVLLGVDLSIHLKIQTHMFTFHIGRM